MLNGVRGIFQLVRHKSIQNFVFLFTIQASNVLISLVAIPLVVSAVGVDNFGLISLALSIVYLLNVVVGYGYNLSGPREVALSTGSEEISLIVSRTIFSKTILSGIAVVAVGALIVAGAFEQYPLILLFSLPMVFAEAIYPLWIFQGLQRMRLISVFNIIGKLLYLLLLVRYVSQPADSYMVNLLLGSSSLVVNAALLLYLSHGWNVQFRWVSLADIFRSWRSNFFLFLSSLASHVSVSSGVILLSFFAGSTALGVYSLAERVGLILRMFPVLVSQAIYPNSSRLFQHDKAGFLTYLRKSYLIALVVSVLISLTSFFLASYTIGFLAGDLINDSVSVLRILSFIPLASCLNIANVIMMLVTDQKKTLFTSTWTFSVYMLVSCTLLASYYGGMGLATGLLIAEAANFLISFVLLLGKERNLTLRFYNLTSAN